MSLISGQNGILFYQFYKDFHFVHLKSPLPAEQKSRVLGPLQGHTTFAESVVCYTASPQTAKNRSFSPLLTEMSERQ